jgi:O-antigen/teichoic acid export membrane protein
MRRHIVFIESAVVGGLIQVCLLVSGVISARLLGVENRGYLALLMVVPVVVAQLGSLGLPFASSLRVAQDAGQRGAVTLFIRRTLPTQILALTGMYGLIAAVVFRDSPDAAKLGAALTALAVTSSLILQYSLGLAQARQEFRRFNVLRLASPAAYSVIVLALLVAHVSASVPLLASAWVFAGWLAAVAGLGLTLARPVIEGDVATPFRSLLDVGLRSLVGTTSPIESFRVDQLLVGLFVSPFALGLYVAATAFTSPSRLIAQSLGFVVFPRVAAQARRADAHRAMWQWLIAGSLIVAAAVGVMELAVGVLVPVLFGGEFEQAVPVARVLLLGGLALACRRLLSDAARGAGHAGTVSIAEALSWLLIVVGVPVAARWGAVGVAVAVCASSVLSLIALVFLLRRAGRAAGIDPAQPELATQAEI